MIYVKSMSLLAHMFSRLVFKSLIINDVYAVVEGRQIVVVRHSVTLGHWLAESSGVFLFSMDQKFGF